MTEDFTLSELEELPATEAAQKRREHIQTRLEAGQELTSKDVAADYDVHQSTARGYLNDIHEELDEVEKYDNGDGHRFVIDDTLDYKWASKMDTQDLVDYMVAEAKGRVQHRRNRELEEKDEVTFAYITEPGWGTKFTDEEMQEGVRYVLEQKAEEGEELDAAVVNGGALPFVSRRSYKTARQWDKVLGTYEGKEDNHMAEWLANPERLESLADDERLPEDEEERQAYLEEKAEEMSEHADLEENRKKITNLGEARDMVQGYIEDWYDAAGDEFDIFYHEGEQDRMNREEMMTLKIRELSSDLVEDRIELLEEKLGARVNNLQGLRKTLDDFVESEEYQEKQALVEDQLEDLQRYISEVTDVHDDAKHIQDREDPDPEDAERLVEEYRESFEEVTDLDVFDELDLADEIVEGIDNYQEHVDTEKQLRSDIRELELNQNAIAEELAYGEMAENFGWVQMSSDVTELLEYLTENEYNEYIHALGEIEDIAQESEPQSLEIGGWDIDVFHNNNVSSDTPNKNGFKKNLKRYQEEYGGDFGDLALFTHHGEFKGQAFRHGYGIENEDITWALHGSTLQDGEKVREEGLEEGLNLVKDVKRMEKGMFDSTLSFITLTTYEAPDGGLRKAYEFEWWDGETLQKIGRAENGEDFIGKDPREQDSIHVISRGDDQVGSPHDLAFAYRSPFENVFGEEMYFTEQYLEEEVDDDEEAIVVDVGDLIQGNNVFPDQKTEGWMLRGEDYNEVRRKLDRKAEEAGLDADTKLELQDELRRRNDAQVQQNNITDQKHRIAANQGKAYGELIDEYDVMLDLIDGNHGNAANGIRASEEVKHLIDTDNPDQITTGSGKDYGELERLIWADDATRPLKLREKHRPEGTGRYTEGGRVLDEDGDQDVLVVGDKHHNAFGKDDDMFGWESGSVQSPNHWTKGKFSAPSPMGGMYVELSRDPDLRQGTVKHIDVQGLNRYSVSDDLKEDILNKESIWPDDFEPDEEINL